MDVVRNTRHSAAARIAVVVAVLIAMAIGASVWYASHQIAPATGHTQSVAAAATSVGPDAGDRNSGILAARLGRAEANHGH
jgi:uncharacterized protein HemX